MTDENLILAFPERKFNLGPPAPDWFGLYPDQNALSVATSLYPMTEELAELQMTIRGLECGWLHPPGYIGPNRKPEEKEPYGSGFIKWIKSLLK